MLTASLLLIYAKNNGITLLVTKIITNVFLNAKYEKNWFLPIVTIGKNLLYFVTGLFLFCYGIVIYI
ncbi:hypothetical protein bthur0004_65540 [Bacillus thuringiensis serovar sotto str. T04001]|nr:hypothetical protein bthur0004_65540 [Bacillus thuringiensis serovar sotto str. T04001]